MFKASPWKIGLTLLLIVVALSTVAWWATGKYFNPREDYTHPPPGTYTQPITDLDPAGVSVGVSFEKAVEIVKRIWDFPDVVPVGKLLNDSVEGRRYWDLIFVYGGRTVGVVTIDADTGELVALTDHRYPAGVDNIGDLNKVVEIARGVLAKLGVKEEILSDPVVTRYTVNTGQLHEGILYDVKWRQTYNGLPVLGGIVIVTINPEVKRPVDIAVRLYNVTGVDTLPRVPREEAVSRARDFLASKGYNVSGLVSVDLVVGRPNYFWDGPFKTKGPATLMWLVEFKISYGSFETQVDVEVDAHTGHIIGGEYYR